MSEKRKTDELDCIKVKVFYVSNDTINKMKDNPQNERKYFQIIHLMKVSYAECIEKLGNSTTKRQY